MDSTDSGYICFRESRTRMRITMSRTFRTIIAVCFFCSMTVSSSVFAEKIKIEKLDDLPRHTYSLSVPAAELFDNDKALFELTAQLRKDMESDLETYDIQDKTTLKGYYGTLGTIAMLEGRYDDYLTLLNKRIALEDKEAIKLTSGLSMRALISAKRSGDKDVIGAFKIAYGQLINPLPYIVVGDKIKQLKGRSQMISRNLLEGVIIGKVQPILDQSGGEFGKDIAQQLVGMSSAVRLSIPYKDAVLDVVTAYLDANQVEKKDIWVDRDISLEGFDKGTNVTIAIWDSGVDVDLFGDNVWTNKNEIAGNGKDDDKNGFIDDVHGIAWTLHSEKTPDLLFPIGDVEKERPVLQRLMKGLSDIGSGIESDESDELKKIMSELKPEDTKPFFENVGKYGNYAHGTHVAGIAAAGNPYAKILATRITFGYTMLPETPTIEQARLDSIATVETIQYFKENGVRVVNMSWGGSVSGVESALEANNAGGTVEERKALARKIFEIGKTALYESIKNAPEILFITSAGNSDNDVSFEEFIPSSFDLPNIISIGAVDQAGDETSFTSFGKVDCYANGFEVQSYVPGGDRMAMSGTSMSSPNVTNLAAKLLTVNPELSPSELIDLILQGCDQKQIGDRVVKLVHPKKTLALVMEK